MEQIKYQVISHFLREQISNGFLKGNEKIPSEVELSKMFNVSRMTARKGIETLVAENILYQVSRMGTFVVPKYEKTEIYLSETQAFNREQRELKSVVNHFEIVPASAYHQELFSLQPTDTLYKFSRIRNKGDSLFAYEKGLIPTKFMKLDKEILQGSLTEYFSSLNISVNKIKKEFKALIPDKEISDVFANNNNSVVFCIDFFRYVQSDELMEFITVYYNQQQCKFIQIIEK